MVEGKEEYDKAQMERWVDGQIEGLPVNIQMEVMKLYPPNPWYMRGEDYSPIDLNETKRLAWISGWKYCKNNNQ